MSIPGTSAARLVSVLKIIITYTIVNHDTKANESYRGWRRPRWIITRTSAR